MRSRPVGFVAAVTAVLALAGCGGGEPQAASPVAQRPAAQAQQAATDPTTGALRVFQAFNGRTPTAAEFAAFSSPDSMVLATGFAAAFTGMSDAALSTAILSNLGINAQTVNAASYSILQTAVTQYFAAYGASARGVIVNNLTGLLANLESDATWGAPARSFNAAVTTARAVVTASTSAGGACVPSVAQGFAGNIETTAASAGDGGGSGGSGGGAAAGGGLGKVLGGTMTVVDLSTGVTVGQGTTDSATGLVTIRTCSLRGPFLLTLEGKAGARYFDEGRNALLDFPAGSVLHALVDTWDEHVGVSPLTEAAYRYALNNFRADPASVAAGTTALAASGNLNGLTAAQVRQAHAIVLAEVNAKLPDSYQLASPKSLPTPIDAGSGTTALGSTRYGKSAAVNGGLVQAANYYNQNVTAPALTLSSGLARDLTDGRIDGFALDGTPIASTDSLTYAHADVALAGTVGTNAVATRFGGSLLSSQLTVDREAFVGTPGGAATQCDDFMDEVGLMSDGSVTVYRRFPTQSGTTCEFRFDAAENARTVKLRNFLTGIKSISNGGGGAMAVKQNGTVYGWGRNFCGSISPSLANAVYSQPQLLPGLQNVTSASSNGFTSIVRDGSGNVFYFGAAGGLSVNSTIPANRAVCAGGGVIAGVPWNQTQYVAMQRAAIPDVVEVLSGFGSLFALTSGGTLYGWGDGVSGLLANSTGEIVDDGAGRLRGTFIANPTPIAGLRAVREIGLAANTFFALQRDGTVMAWGDDSAKLLGRGTQQRTLRPTAVAGLANITHMATSFESLRLQRADGGILAWGRTPQGSSTVLFNPTVITPGGRVRYFSGWSSGYSVFLGTGAVVRDVNDTVDVSDRYR